MSEQMLAQVPVKGSKFICTELTYNLGGYNFGTGEREPRGYRVMVTPEEITENTRIFTGFSGYKHIVHVVKRKSEKARREALKKTLEEKDMVQRMVRAVCIQEGLSENETERIIKETMEGIEAKANE